MRIFTLTIPVFTERCRSWSSSSVFFNRDVISPSSVGLSGMLEEPPLCSPEYRAKQRKRGRTFRPLKGRTRHQELTSFYRSSSPSPPTRSPVKGSRNSRPLWPWKLNMWKREPACLSREFPPSLAPPSQLSSIKRVTEDWSVMEWSTKLNLAKDEITSKGWRGP